MSNFRSKITIVCLVASVIAAISTIPISSYAQKQTDFVATLSGKNVVPPVNTPATGTAKFHVNPNGTLSYEVDVNNIKNVIGTPIKLKNGAELAQLLNVYATVNQKSFTQSLGPVSGKLSGGILTANDIYGPLIGKNITDLLSFFNNKSAFVVVRTTEHQPGEIQGQVVPGIGAPTAAPAAGMNKTAGIGAPTAAPAAGMNKTAGIGAPTTATPGMSAPTTATPAMNATTSAGLNKTSGISAPATAEIVCQHVQIKGKEYIQCPI
jgi:hypothetical protein